MPRVILSQRVVTVNDSKIEDNQRQHEALRGGGGFDHMQPRGEKKLCGQELQTTVYGSYRLTVPYSGLPRAQRIE